MNCFLSCYRNPRLAGFVNTTAERCRVQKGGRSVSSTSIMIFSKSGRGGYAGSRRVAGVSVLPVPWYLVSLGGGYAGHRRVAGVSVLSVPWYLVSLGYFRAGVGGWPRGGCKNLSTSTLRGGGAKVECSTLRKPPSLTSFSNNVAICEEISHCFS